MVLFKRFVMNFVTISILLSLLGVLIVISEQIKSLYEEITRFRFNTSSRV